jgi:hypothetical protein
MVSSGIQVVVVEFVFVISQALVDWRLGLLLYRGRADLPKFAVQAAAPRV